MRVGLYSTQTGVRTRLAGNDDGQRRYMLGNVIVANHGTTLRFEPAPAPISGSIIDFGALRTDGLIYLKRDSSRWSCAPSR